MALSPKPWLKSLTDNIIFYTSNRFKTASASHDYIELSGSIKASKEKLRFKADFEILKDRLNEDKGDRHDRKLGIFERSKAIYTRELPSGWL
jgi:hypothetical protein